MTKKENEVLPEPDCGEIEPIESEPPKRAKKSRKRKPKLYQDCGEIEPLPLFYLNVRKSRERESLNHIRSVEE